MKRWTLWLLVCGSVVSAWAAPLDPLLAKPELWELPPADFEAAAQGLGFRWVSQTHDSARAANAELTAFGLPTVEAIVRFDGGRMTGITIAIYARGDAGDLPKERYDALVRSAVEALNTRTQVKFTARGKDAASAVKADGVFWDTPQAHYLLEYSATREVKTRDIAFRAEFVRLEITPPQKKPALLTATATTLAQAKFNGPQHLQREPTSGDVWIGDVPMVDQGRKSNSLVANLERVIRYYGSQVEASELAQIATTNPDGNMTYNGTFAALKKVSARLKVRVRQLDEMDVKVILDLVKEYNRAARQSGVPELPDPGQQIDIGTIYRAMQWPILKQARLRSHAEFGRFQRELQLNIDHGIPLLWIMQMGIVPESGIPQNPGSHLRLIIGYNTKTSEILLSDSWGAGHELKRMDWGDAWTITTGLAKIEPL